MRTPSALGARVKAFRTADGTDERTLGWLQIRCVVGSVFVAISWHYAANPPVLGPYHPITGLVDAIGAGLFFGALAAYFAVAVAVNFFYPLQAQGILPIVIAVSTRSGLRAGSIGATLAGRSQKLGTEAKVRFETAQVGRPWRDLGLKDSHVWTIITGGFRTSVVTPVELNRDVERQLRDFLDDARAQQLEYAASGTYSAR